jgi:hypothetical protein
MRTKFDIYVFILPILTAFNKLKNLSEVQDKQWLENLISTFLFILVMFEIISFYYILSSNKGIFVWPIWPEVHCPYFHTPGK